MKLTVVMPVLDEAATIVEALVALQPLRAAGCEVIVADGGSRDDTVALATPLCDRLVRAPRGRALQMNAGAASAGGDALLFLHADTRLPTDALAQIAQALARAGWGRFDVRIDGRPRLLRLIAALMNFRSRLTGIATGDQALFCTRSLFERLGAYAPIPLMEDIDFSRRALAHGRPVCLRTRVLTSGRRWEKHGVLPTVLLMWRLRLRYFLGADPARLAADYRPHHE